MKLYCIFGIEYHIGRTLLGIYDSRKKAEEELKNSDSYFDLYGFDNIKIVEIELNSNIDIE